MSSAKLEACIQLPIPEDQLEETIDKAKDWILMHGGSMYPKNEFNKNVVQFIPFALLPSSFPRKEFEKARDVQTIVNELMHKVAHDCHFMKECLKSTIEVDDFTAKLFNICEIVCAEGIAQTISLGLLRSDYMLHSFRGNQIMQVELNTIACSFASIATKITQCHRYVLKELGHEDKLKNLPENDALSGFSNGLTEAWKLYNNEKAVILFVVEDITYNICDQRFIEFEIRRLNPRIKVLRRSLTDLVSQAHLGPNKELIVGNSTVAVVYFRAGYAPHHYPTEDEWSLRLLIERSQAIKCPSIQYHLAGTKKVQQALAQPGVLEKYLEDPKLVAQVREIFTGLYSLDFDNRGEEAVAMGLTEPDRFVLKPQREGGGYNVYGDDVRIHLEAMKDNRERTAWILMDYIHPPLQKNYLVRPGSPIDKKPQDIVSELGTFGVMIADQSGIKVNRQVGHILRTKPSTENEGGIVAGIGALDSPYLLD